MSALHSSLVSGSKHISLRRVQIFFTTSINVHISGFGTAASADDASRFSRLGILSVLPPSQFGLRFSDSV